MNNQDLENEKKIDVLEYVKENFLGILLLFVAFFIVYFVDYINRINIIIYSTPSQIYDLKTIMSSSKISKRKLKKR